MASTYFVPKPDPNLEPRRLDRVLARMMPPLLRGPSEHREGQNGEGQGNPSAGTCAGGGRWAEVRLPGQEGEHASGREVSKSRGTHQKAQHAQRKSVSSAASSAGWTWREEQQGSPGEGLWLRGRPDLRTSGTTGHATTTWDFQDDHSGSDVEDKKMCSATGEREK